MSEIFRPSMPDDLKAAYDDQKMVIVSRYREEDWPQLLELCDGFEPTYKHWKAINDKIIKEMKQAGKHIEFMDIAVDDIRPLTILTGRKTTPDQRATLVHQKYSDKLKRAH